METEKPDIALVMLHYGLDVTHLDEDEGWRSVCCPFHDDSSASARVSRDQNRFQCFVCQDYSGDSIDIIRSAEKVGYVGALEFARDNLGYSGGDVLSPARPEQYRPSWTEEGD